MGINFCGVKTAAGNERLRAVNPEAALEHAHGDVGRFVPPPLEKLESDMRAWLRYWLGLTGGICAAFVVGIALFAIMLWWLGVLGFAMLPRRASFLFLLALSVAAPAQARDPDGKYANSPLKQWFDQLASGKGLCCSFTDGAQVDDVDWDTRDGRYRVRLHGEWIVVPDAAVVTEPNRYGPAVVWPYLDASGQTQIRCFMPGAGT